MSTDKELTGTSPMVPGRDMPTILRLMAAASAETPQSPPGPRSLMEAIQNRNPVVWFASGQRGRLHGCVDDPIPVDIPARSILFRDEKQGVGIPCSVCGVRGTVRVGPRVYACQRNECGAFSLVSIGRQGTDGFKTYRCTPTSAEANEAARRISQAYGRQEYEVRDDA